MAINCYVSSNICRNCRDSVGGITAAYVIAGPVTGVTYTSGDTIDKIGAISGSVYSYQFEKGTSVYTETINASIENGTVFYQQDLTMVFFKVQAAIRSQIKLLAANTNLKVIVEFNDGSLFYLGQTFGMTLSAGEASSGTAYGDRNGYSLTLTGLEAEPARELANPLSSTFIGLSLQSCSI
jgi:hypothetical protein